jgi:hypothetical protein
MGASVRLFAPEVKHMFAGRLATEHPFAKVASVNEHLFAHHPKSGRYVRRDAGRSPSLKISVRGVSAAPDRDLLHNTPSVRRMS